MMHKPWCCLGEVPYCFSMSSVKFQGHAAKKIVDFAQFGRFRTVTPVWIHQWLRNDAQSLHCHRRGALLFFKVNRQIPRSHGTKKSPILTRIERFLTVTPVWIDRWLWKMMHKAWSSIEEAPYWFWMSSIIFQGHAGQIIADFDPNRAFLDCNSSLNTSMAFKWSTKLWSSMEDVSYCFSRSSFKFQGHAGHKITDFDPNWAFPGCNSS